MLKSVVFMGVMVVVCLVPWSKAEEAGQGNIPALPCPLAKTPVMDGKINTEEWKSAAKATGFYSLAKPKLTDEELRNIYRAGTSLSPNQARVQTEVFLMRDTENLYIAFRCFEPKLDKLKMTCKENNGAVWADDSVEVFLDTRLDQATYFQFAANAAGTRYAGRQGDAGWYAEWEAKTSINRELSAYEVEMAIPFKTLGKEPGTKEVWGLNLCRNRVADAKERREVEHSSWADVSSSGSFRVPALFGHLVFSDSFDGVSAVNRAQQETAGTAQERFREKPDKVYFWFETEDQEKFSYGFPWVETPDADCRGGKSLALKISGRISGTGVIVARLGNWHLPPGDYHIYAKVFQYAPILYTSEFEGHKAKGISYKDGSTDSTHDANATSFSIGEWVALKIADIKVTETQVDGKLQLQFGDTEYNGIACKIDAIVATTDDEFGFTKKDKEDISKIAKKVGELRKNRNRLKELIEKAEQNKADTTYARMKLGILDLFLEYPLLEAREQKIKRGFDQLAYLLPYSQQAQTEVEGIIKDPENQIKFPTYDVTKIKIKGSDFYSGSRPVFLDCPGYLGNITRESIPVLKRLGLNFLHASASISEKGVSESQKGKILGALKDAEKAGIRIALLIYENENPFRRTDCVLENPEKSNALMQGVREIVSWVKDQPALFGYDILGEYEQQDWPIGPDGKCLRGNDFDKYLLPLFEAWLKKRHGNIENLNRIWNTGYKDFSEIQPDGFVKKDGGNGRYDWELFRRERSVDLVKKYIAAIRELDSERPISVMTMGIDRCFMDTESICPLTDISGCDPGPQCETLYGEDEGIYYGTLRSFDRSKPLINWEYHTYRIRPPTPQWLSAMLWKGYLHGLDGISLFFWTIGRRCEASPASWNNICTQPQLADAVCRTFLDTQRLAPYIVKFQALSGEAAILYSLTSFYHQKNYRIDYELGTKPLYQGITCLGVPVDYVTERSVAQGELKKYKALVLAPSMSKYVAQAAYEEIKRFVKEGGLLITASPEALTMDEYGRQLRPGDKDALPEEGGYGQGRIISVPPDLPAREYCQRFDKIFDEAKLPRPIRLLDKQTGELAYGVEARYLKRGKREIFREEIISLLRHFSLPAFSRLFKQSDQRIIYLLNLTSEDKRIKINGLEGKYKDLITGQPVPDMKDIAMKGYGVLLMESER